MVITLFKCSLNALILTNQRELPDPPDKKNSPQLQTPITQYIPTVGLVSNYRWVGMP